MDASRRFYVYHWLRPEGTPFYVGLGSGDRYLHQKRNPIVRSIYREILSQGLQVQKVKIQEDLTRQEAVELEIGEINRWGRIHLGTGILGNLGPGGETGPAHDGPSPLRGRKITGRRLIEMSWARHGNTARRGTSQPQEFKDHLSRVMKGNQHLLGHKHSQETKAKIAAKSRAYHERRRALEQGL